MKFSREKGNFQKSTRVVLCHRKRLMRMAKGDYLKISSVYELQGLDFVMDEDLNLWFIETNPGPAVETVTPFSTELFRTMFLDIYDIEIGLLRSRMKRVNEYVNP